MQSSVDEITSASASRVIVAETATATRTPTAVSTNTSSSSSSNSSSSSSGHAVAIVVGGDDVTTMPISPTIASTATAATAATDVKVDTASSSSSSAFIAAAAANPSTNNNSEEEDNNHNSNATLAIPKQDEYLKKAIARHAKLSTTTTGVASASAAAGAMETGQSHLQLPRQHSHAPTLSKTLSSSSSKGMIEKLIGYVYDEYKCVHTGPLGMSNHAGILYVGPLGCVFLARMFLFEWTVTISWEDVLKVKRKLPRNPQQSWGMNTILIEMRNQNDTTNTSTNNGISGNNNTTSRNSNGNNIQQATTNTNTATTATTVHSFEDLFDVHKALEVLITLHNDYVVDKKSNKSSLRTNNNSTANRSSSSSSGINKNSSSSNTNSSDTTSSATSLRTSVTRRSSMAKSKLGRSTSDPDLLRDFTSSFLLQEKVGGKQDSSSRSEAATRVGGKVAVVASATATGTKKEGMTVNTRKSSLSSIASVETEASSSTNTPPSLISPRTPTPASPAPTQYVMDRDFHSLPSIQTTHVGDDTTNNNEHEHGTNVAPKVTERIDRETNTVVNKSKIGISKEEERKLQAEFSKVYNDINSCKEIAIEDREIVVVPSTKSSTAHPIMDVSTFVEYFLKDDARYCMSKYMNEIVGDTEISVTEWTPPLSVKEFSLSPTMTKMKRTIEYTHPVSRIK